MAQVIINHTNPKKAPVTGDWIEIKDGNSSIKKQFWEAPKLTAKEIATELAREMRAWRDDQLLSTDYIVALTDHPERDAYLKYREKLRNWPALKSFPKTKPKL